MCSRPSSTKVWVRPIDTQIGVTPIPVGGTGNGLFLVETEPLYDRSPNPGEVTNSVSWSWATPSSG